MSLSHPGDDESGAAVWGCRCGGQFGVRSSVPDLQLHCGRWDHPAPCERTAAPALPPALHIPASGQSECVHRGLSCTKTM